MRVVIVGGGAAGMSAASRVKRLRRDWEVVVLERTRWVSFALCGIPYYTSCMVKRLEDLVHYPASFFREKRGIDVRLGHEVVDVEDGRVRVRSGGDEYTLDYDFLVLATGAKPVVPRSLSEALELDGVYAIAHLDDAERLRRRLEAGARKPVVIGGGLLGLELAEALHSWGLKVTIVEKMERLLPAMLDPELGDKLTSIVSKVEGVEVVTGRGAASIEGSGRVERVVLEGGETLDADLVVLSVGRRPDTSLAERLGLRIGESGAVWTDERMATSKEGVYAVGDVAEVKSVVLERNIWCPFAQVANKMGYVAGSNIAGVETRLRGVACTSATRVFGVTVAKTGLSLEEAKRLGFDAGAADVEAGTKAKYIPGGSWIHLRVVYDRSTGRLLGAQALSGDESGFWRVNVVAALLMKKAEIWDLFEADIGYTPLLSPVWDPLVIAARLALREVGGRR